MPTMLVAAMVVLGLALGGLAVGYVIAGRSRRRWAELRPPETPAPADLLDRLRSVEARLDRLERRATRPERATAPAQDRSEPAPKRTRRLDRRQAATNDGPVLIAVPDLAGPGSLNSAEAAAEFDRRFGAIGALADSGIADDEIARRTGYPIGQVELILGLRRPRPGGRTADLPPQSTATVTPTRGDDAPT